MSLYALMTGWRHVEGLRSTRRLSRWSVNGDYNGHIFNREGVTYIGDGATISNALSISTI